MNKIFKKGVLLFISLIVVLVFLEAGVRAWDPNGSIHLYQKDLFVGRTYKPNLNVEVRADNGSYAHLKTNKYGFIGDDISKKKPANILRIANLGDSFTSGHDVDYEKKYTTLLGSILSEELGIEVESLNFGIPSQGTSETYLRYKYQAREFDPDVVILYFYLGNDFSENLESINALQEKFTRVEEGSRWRRTVKKSELVLYILNRFVQIPFTNHLMYGLGIIQEKGEFIETKDPVDELPPRLSLIFTTGNERNEESIAMTIEHLRILKESIVSDNKKFMVVVLPRHFQVEERVKNNVVAQYPLLSEFDLDTTRPNKVIAEILKELEISYVDVTEHFRSECKNSCTLYICDMCHLGPDGHRLVSDIVSQFLVEKLSRDNL